MNNEKSARVWDPGVRLFHWGLVTTFTVSYLSGEMHDLHTWSGYVLLALLLFRIFWGFAGGNHARFADFLYGPRAVFAYLRGLATGKPIHYSGHNPAGAWAIYLMLFLLLSISFTGLKALALEGDGPFADNRFSLIATASAHGNEVHTPAPMPQALAAEKEPVTDHKDSTEKADSPASVAPPSNEEKFWSDSHHLLVNLMLVLVGIHIIAVLVSSVLHRENLVRAMITGNKPTKE